MKESQDLANAIAVKDMEITELKNQCDSFVDESNLRDKLIEQKRQEAFHEQQRNAPSPSIKFKHHERLVDMNKIIILASTILILSCLSSCSKETKSVQWYKEHPEVLKTEFEKCKLKTLPEVASDKHCMVVIQAQSEAFHEQQRNAPSPIIKFKHHEN